MSEQLPSMVDAPAREKEILSYSPVLQMHHRYLRRAIGFCAAPFPFVFVAYLNWLWVKLPWTPRLLMATAAAGLIGTAYGLALFLADVTRNWHALSVPSERENKMLRILVAAAVLVGGFLIYWSLGIMPLV
jgi:hypothetical protein